MEIQQSKDLAVFLECVRRLITSHCLLWAPA